MDGATDDPSGKHHKSSQQNSRKQTLYGVLFTGICLGFMASQQLYMRHQRQLDEQVPSRQLRQKAPRSELESILQRVAPQREVMIAISNYNLIIEGMLTTWLEVTHFTRQNVFLLLAKPPADLCSMILPHPTCKCKSFGGCRW